MHYITYYAEKPTEQPVQWSYRMEWRYKIDEKKTEYKS